MDYRKRIAARGLNINAIKLRPDDPFTWASGYKMPIYNDNRMFLFYPQHRRLIADSFVEILGDLNDRFEVIAGTSTAGIPPATLLADRLNKPLIYVRDKPKDHGLKNQIEGIDAESNLDGQRVIFFSTNSLIDENSSGVYHLYMFDASLDEEASRSRPGKSSR